MVDDAGLGYQSSVWERYSMQCESCHDFQMNESNAPLDEERRLKARLQYGVLDTLPEEALDDLTSAGGNDLRGANRSDLAVGWAAAVVQI